MQFVSSTLYNSYNFVLRVKVTGKLWIVPYNLEALAKHLVVTDQAHRFDQSVLAKVTVAHKTTREWSSRTASLSCAVLKPVFICHQGLLSGQEACCRLYHCFNRSFGRTRVIWELQFFLYNSILNMLIALLELIKHTWMKKMKCL